MSVETAMSLGPLVVAVTFATFEVVGRFPISRWVLAEVARLFVLLELGALRLVQRIYPPRYVLTGSCNMRGTCCTLIVGDPPRFVKDRPLWLGLFVAYHRVVHNFHVTNRGPDGEVIFSCHHLRDDGRCGIYRHRPFICRNYPVVPWFTAPRPLPGCGYGLMPRVVARMGTRTTLPILNPKVAVHHPTREGGRLTDERPEDFHWIEAPPDPRISDDVLQGGWTREPENR